MAIASCCGECLEHRQFICIMRKLLGTIALITLMEICPANAQTGNYSSPVDAYLKTALELVQGGDYDRAIAQYKLASENANDGCDRGHAIAGITAARAAKAKLASMPGHPHRGQAADTEFWSVLTRESDKLPAECKV